MIHSLTNIAESIHKTNKEKGFWEDCEILSGADTTDLQTSDITYDFDPKQRNLGEAIALCHEELSEALGDYRDSRDFNEVYFEDKSTGLEYTYNEAIAKWGSLEAACRNWKPCGVAIEFIDCWIRIMDLFGAYGTDVDGLLRMKRIYNETRPYKHGRRC